MHDGSLASYLKFGNYLSILAHAANLIKQKQLLVFLFLTIFLFNSKLIVDKKNTECYNRHMTTVFQGGLASIIKRKSIPNLAGAGWISFLNRKANPPCGRLSFYTHFSTYVHFLQENTCYFLCSFLFYGQNLHFHLAKCSMPSEGVAESPFLDHLTAPLIESM